MEPNVEKVQERLGEPLITIELNPPEKEKLQEQMGNHKKYLSKLFQSVPEVNGINLPEIQEEEKKGERGNRKSDFKDRISPRQYTLRLREQFQAKFIINRVIVKVPPENQEDWAIKTYHDYDIDSIVVVGGESSDRTYPGPSVPEGNTLIKKHLNKGTRRYGTGEIQPTDYLLGNICISNRRRESFDEPDRMVRKIETGCDFFTSQIIAEAESAGELLRDFAAMLQDREQNPPAIFWSFTPINSKKDVRFLRWLGVKIPDYVEEKILSSETPLQTSLDHFENVMRELLATEERLSIDIPLGVNVSPVAFRNLNASLSLVKRLIPLL